MPSSTESSLASPGLCPQLPEANGSGDLWRRNAETVLLVDHDGAVRTVLARSGHTVLEAESGLEALRIGEQYNGPIHLLLTDLVMPELSGRELMERLRLLARARHPC